MKKQLYRTAAATVLGLSLTTGIVAADAGNIHTTGPGSTNQVSTHVRTHTRVQNDNNVDLTNDNTQRGYSGDAKVTYNTTGGDATSGDVSNDNSTKAKVSIDNNAGTGKSNSAPMHVDGQGGGDISNTGPNSSNEITTSVETKTDVSNMNYVTVDNSNYQSGTSGDATVSNNTTGGNATSGSVYNTNSSSFTISIKN